MAYNDYQNQMPMNGYYNGNQQVMPMPTMQTPLYNRGYQQAAYQPQQQYSQSQGQLMSDWVLGEMAARAYPVPAGRMSFRTPIAVLRPGTAVVAVSRRNWR